MNPDMGDKDEIESLCAIDTSPCPIVFNFEDNDLLEDEPIKTENPTISYKYSVDSICGRRSSLEDTYKIVDNGKYLYLGIFDGHCGCKIADILKNEFDAYLFKILDTLEITKESIDTKIDQIKATLIQTCIDFDVYLHDKKHQLEIYNQGSTAIVVIEICDVLFLINIGDSRAIIVTENKIQFETKDHKPIDEEDRIVEAGGGVIRGKVSRVTTNHADSWIAVSRAFGDFNFKKNTTGEFTTTGALIAVPDVTAIKKPKDGFVLLSCDGLFEKMTSQQVIDHIISNQNDLELCKNLNQKGLESGSRDNITTMVVFF